MCAHALQLATTAYAQSSEDIPNGFVLAATFNPEAAYDAAYDAAIANGDSVAAAQAAGAAAACARPHGGESTLTWRPAERDCQKQLLNGCSSIFFDMPAGVEGYTQVAGKVELVAIATNDAFDQAHANNPGAGYGLESPNWVDGGVLTIDRPDVDGAGAPTGTTHREHVFTWAVSGFSHTTYEHACPPHPDRPGCPNRGLFIPGSQNSPPPTGPGTAWDCEDPHSHNVGALFDGSTCNHACCGPTRNTPPGEFGPDWLRQHC